MKLTIQVLQMLLVLSFVTVKSIDARIDHHVMQGLAETQWGANAPMLPNVLPPAKGLTRMDGKD